MHGIQRCLVGYSGGAEENPCYSEMKDYTESIFVEFTKGEASYEGILEKWKSLSAPYPASRQYRTAVFFLGKEQEKIARAFCESMENVDVEPVTKFYMAENRHQNFLGRK
jgi:peptide methionine sulfoxide reductase MsrA